MYIFRYTLGHVHICTSESHVCNCITLISLKESSKITAPTITTLRSKAKGKALVQFGAQSNPTLFNLLANVLTSLPTTVFCIISTLKSFHLSAEFKTNFLLAIQYLHISFRPWFSWPDLWIFCYLLKIKKLLRSINSLKS